MYFFLLRMSPNFCLIVLFILPPSVCVFDSDFFIGFYKSTSRAKSTKVFIKHDANSITPTFYIISNYFCIMPTPRENHSNSEN